MCYHSPSPPYTLFSNAKRALGLGLELATVIATHVVSMIRIVFLLLLFIIMLLLLPAKQRQPVASLGLGVGRGRGLGLANNSGRASCDLGLLS